MQPTNVLDTQTAEKQIKGLQDEVTKHDVLYDLGKPVITDSEYDKLYLELESLEKQFPQFVTPESPTQRIVAVIVDSLKKVTHTTPMLSQDKVHTAEDIRKFSKKASSDILAQLKLDGLTIVLTYDEGRLISAVTRGDGYIGEDVTHTIQTSQDVPKRISFKGRLEVRAEALITFTDFKRINEDGTYATTRNLASGTVRQLDANVAKARNIRVISFEFVSAMDMTFTHDVQRLEFMTELGFNVVPYEVFNHTDEGIQSLVDYCEGFHDSHRKNLDYAIDGLVLKFDDLYVREDLGYTNKFPRWGCAFKFESLEATTTLIRVVNQVGKSGQVTPVAEFETVNIDGVNISRATLHNFRNIKEKDIRIGDRIVVARANDVIPQVVQSIKEVRQGAEELVEAPATCPACESPTEAIGENLYCTGLDCILQLEGKLEHFVSRKTLNIDGLGQKTVKMLLNKGFITSVTDLFRLKQHEKAITSMDGFGQKKFDKMIEGIEQAKKNPLHKVLYSLSIRQIGETASKEVSKKFATMNDIIELSKDEDAFRTKLLSLDDFGATMTESMVDFFTNEQNIQVLRELQSFGFEMVSDFQKSSSGSDILTGKTFVITGKMPSGKGRDEIKQIIESNGGKASGSVSKKTDYLLMGDGEEGSSKHKKALDLGTKIISESDFEALLK